MYKRTEYACVFFAGGTIYTVIEMIWRGYSHWTMTIAGGICMLIVHRVNHLLRYKRSISGYAAKCAVCAVGITAVEFAVGVVVNLVLDLNVWDYSRMSGNVLGQICPAYSAAWFGISAVALKLSDGIGKLFEFLEKRETIRAT